MAENTPGLECQDKSNNNIHHPHPPPTATTTTEIVKNSTYIITSRFALRRSINPPSQTAS